MNYHERLDELETKIDSIEGILRDILKEIGRLKNSNPSPSTPYTPYVPQVPYQPYQPWITYKMDCNEEGITFNITDALS